MPIWSMVELPLFIATIIGIISLSYGSSDQELVCIHDKVRLGNNYIATNILVYSMLYRQQT